jgi:hypothetical protein
MKATPLEDLVEQWKNDSKINKIDPDKDLLTIPNLHSKYAAELVAHSAALKQKTRALTSLTKVKWLYFMGKLDQKELKERGWEPFQFILKGDVNIYLDADSEILALKEVVDAHEDAIEFCKMIVKQISDRTWQIKSYLDYAKYTVGS